MIKSETEYLAVKRVVPSDRMALTEILKAAFTSCSLLR